MSEIRFTNIAFAYHDYLGACVFNGGFTRLSDDLIEVQLKDLNAMALA
jgi:hypothetical protein